MPCGQLDKRRGGHRCAACRKSHIRCDGLSPCSNCQTRGVACSMPRRMVDVQIVNVAPDPRQALVVPSWKHVGFFHQATGELPLSAIFHCDQMLSLSQTDEDIFRTISSIGQLYAAHMGFGTPSSRCEAHLRTSLKTDKKLCREKMRRQRNGRALGFLPSAMVLAVAELLLDDTADGWRGWIETVFNYISPSLHNLEGLSDFEQDLLRFWQLNNVLGSLARPETPLGFDFSRSLPTGQDTTPGSFSRTYDHLLSVLWRVSDLDKRIYDWTAYVSQDLDHQHNITNTVRGLNIVTEMSGLQAEVLDVILNTFATQAPIPNSLEPFYRWVLIGTSQVMQQHAGLQNLQCALPVLPRHCARDQFVAILDEIERLVTQPTLDIAYFLPMMETLHLSPFGEESKPRVSKLLDKAEYCGFGVAKALREQEKIVLQSSPERLCIGRGGQALRAGENAMIGSMVWDGCEYPPLNDVTFLLRHTPRSIATTRWFLESRLRTPAQGLWLPARLTTRRISGPE